MTLQSDPKRLLGVIFSLLLTGWLPVAAQGNSGKGSPGKSSSTGEQGKEGKASKAGKQSKTPGAILEKTTRLSATLQGLLTPGTDLQNAVSGFKNLGQFVAAVHVSHNLGISFDQLKAQMVNSGLSLGQAIHKLKPDVNAQSEARKGQNEATGDLQAAGLLLKKP
jgi:hypothetical protein